jgi:gamma-glutamylcyclotransferase (GGCT)/AIG2-like uncharacterized protein YtfP
MAYLFSYGSNHPGQLAQRLGHPVMTLSAYAPGYQRVFRGFSRSWGGGVASLEKARGGNAFGLVVPVSESDLKTLDRFEGVPFAYERAKIAVLVGDGRSRKTAVAYLAKSRTFGAPTREYLEAVSRTVSVHWRHEDGSPIDPEEFPLR